MAAEHVTLVTAGGPIRIVVKANIENALLPESETTGQLLDDVRRAVCDGIALDNIHGARTLITPRHVIAYVYGDGRH